MGHPRIKANKCKYKKKIEGSKNNYINAINHDAADDDMLTEIMRELTVIKKK